MTDAHAIIRNNRYLVLATSHDGETWAAPLAYVYDAARQAFYFYSARDSRHGRHIAANPRAAITIFDSAAPSESALGLQCAVRVEEVGADALQSVAAFYFAQSFPDENERRKWQKPASAFTGAAPQRFYKITPQDCYLNDVDDRMIDCRRDVALRV